jgi:quercetin dioxygenase-like cupin family protein
MAKPAPFTRTLDDAPLISVAGDLYAILASGEETGGAYALFEAIVTPGNGPPLHVHSREDETFYVLDGEVTFTIAGQQRLSRAGGFFHGPRGIEHTLKNTGSKPARLLVTVLPAGFEKFLREIGDPLPKGSTKAMPITPQAIEKLMKIAPRYGLEIRAPA